jgi:hypothetical protein
MAGPPDFTEARALFAKYYQQKRRGSSHGGLMDEAAKRLGQLDWIVHRVARLQDMDKRAWQRGWKPDPRRDTVEQHARDAVRQRALGDEIELLSETFYYFAWRFRCSGSVSEPRPCRSARRRRPCAD